MSTILGRHPLPLFPGADASPGWMHSGVALASDGRVVVASPDGDALVVLGADGSEVGRVPLGTTALHGITRDEIDGTEVFWIADNGHRYVPGGAVYDDHRTGARLFATDLDGVVRAELTAPEGGWSPTAVVVHADLVWVGDGYGQSLVHAFDREGDRVLSADGAESGRPFDCPHGLVLDDRADEPVLVVADRANQRLVELDLRGRTRRVLPARVHSPSGLAVDGEHLLVTELWGDLVVVDRAGEVVARASEQSTEPARPGWPNDVRDGVTVRPRLRDGVLNSPHGIAVDPRDGSWMLTEWCIGGRVTRLLPVG